MTRRAFLKKPENFSGPKAFRGSFRVIFSGPGKGFSKPPETARIPCEDYGIFLGLAGVGQGTRAHKTPEIEPGKRILECFGLCL